MTTKNKITAINETINKRYKNNFSFLENHGQNESLVLQLAHGWVVFFFKVDLQFKNFVLVTRILRGNKTLLSETVEHYKTLDLCVNNVINLLKILSSNIKIVKGIEKNVR